ncbi:hypothetical protein Z951_15495 [Streptomyces sp. PRh5]|nr:hypothetical protein Z951_15495 [Streptomyces sp. PRh5]
MLLPLIVPDQPETSISASLGTALLRILTGLECVMSSWWFAQAGSGEAAVEDVVAVRGIGELRQTFRD